jgi:hypothetical protein
LHSRLEFSELSRGRGSERRRRTTASRKAEAEFTFNFSNPEALFVRVRLVPGQSDKTEVPRSSFGARFPLSPVNVGVAPTWRLLEQHS